MSDAFWFLLGSLVGILVAGGVAVAVVARWLSKGFRF